MHFSRIASIIVASTWLGIVAFIPGVLAQEKLRIGILGQFSGPMALSGKAYQQAIQAYTSVYGTRVGGREVEILYRDVGGTNASTAKRLAEELIVRDQVSVIGGFYLSSEPIAAAPVLTETNTPGVVFNGGARVITEASPLIVRVAATMHQYGSVGAEWAIKNGYKSVYISVSDYSAGHETLAAFKKRYTELGGEVIGEDKIPLNTVDFSPYIERVARSKPSLFVTFVAANIPSIVKALQAQGLTGRKDLAIVGLAELEEATLPLFDDSVVGMFDELPYAIEAPGDENKKYRDALRVQFGAGAIPSYFGATAWDGMHVIYQMIRSQQGRKFDGTAAVKAVLAYKLEGARGPLMIEPDTRSTTTNVYIRRAVKGPDGKLKLEVADTFKGVRSIP